MTNKTVFSPVFLLLAVLFCVCIIVANLMEIKTVELGPPTITAGFVVFPLSYIISDCIVEIYGFSRARFVIWLGFAMNLLVTLLLQLGLALPSHATWHHQEAMQIVFGATPRIFAASFTAFLCGSMVNAYVMSRMKAGREGPETHTLRHPGPAENRLRDSRASCHNQSSQDTAQPRRCSGHTHRYYPII